MSGGARRMPDLCTPGRAFRHDMDAAMAALRRLGVEPERITIRSGGPGGHPGAVLRQIPAPGTPLSARTRVELTVAGSGGLDLLPYPLRDEDDDEFRVDRLMALFDNPLLKLALHVRQAGGFLALHPDEPVTALRWIEEIFAVSAAPFPRECWYPLARLLPALHRVAGTEGAVALAFGGVFGLPVASVRAVRAVVPLGGEGRTRLGERASRLGVDAVAGEGLVERSALEVTFGHPEEDGRVRGVDLDVWRRHTAPGRRAQRDALYRLVLPWHLDAGVRERWEVGDARAPARPGDPDIPALLGVNGRLGEPPARRAA